MAGDKQVKKNTQFILSFLAKLEQYETFIEEKLPNAKLKAVELRLNDIETMWCQFKKCLPPFDTFDELQITDDTITSIEKLYFEIIPELMDRIDTLRAEKTNPEEKPVQTQLNYHLPEIEVEHFYGDYMHWRSFIGTFDSLIGSNSSLPELAKFQYLKRALKGPASQTIESLDFVEKNYNVARDLLKERYDKDNLICERHIKELFAFKNLDRPCSKRILELIDHFNSHLRSLDTLGRPVNKWDDLIVFIMVSKLDPETRSRWVDNSPSARLATINDLNNFLKSRAQKLENQPKTNLIASNAPKSSTKPTSRSIRPSTSLTVTKSSKPIYKCSHCNLTGHSIVRCHKFLSLPMDDRLKFVRDCNLCNNCLREGHSQDSCPISDKCRHCQGPHHSLLHGSNFNKSHHDSVETPTSAHISSSVRSVERSRHSPFVYLATALVHVINRHGQPIEGRALLDSGSQINFISTSFMSKLKLDSVHSSTKIHGIGQNAISSTSTASIKLKSRESNFSTILKVHVLPTITEYQPTLKVKDINHWTIPKNIHLADPHFFEQQPIDILIGAEIYYDLLSVGQIKLGNNFPTLQNSVLGWIVSGKCDIFHQQNPVCHLVSEGDIPLNSQIERFWNVEDIPTESTSNVSQNENECESHYTKFTTRDNDGRFVVKLPFSCNPAVLGDSKLMASRRFYYLEQKMNKSPDLYKSYSSFMQEYLNLGHMKLIESDMLPSPNFFLPHHAVFKPNSSTTKLRVVFDGSAKSSSSMSLNDVLQVGPTVQNELFNILLRFRLHEYAFSADICKMYRQIRVHNDDQAFQCILWRNGYNESLRSYKLTTVTYGTSCAPFLATRCLVQLAKDFSTKLPHASDSILKDIYVDDLLSGAQSISEARKLKEDIEHILATAGMQLRKWCSNDSQIIEGVPIDHRETLLKIDENDLIKTLGILWQPSTDVFTFSINLSDLTIVTKRSIFSQIARIFDPLGLLAPVVVIGKLLIQSLWLLKLNWDQSLPQNLHTQWLQFRDSLHYLNQFSIKRFVFESSNYSTTQLHGFCDASEKAYGAVLYIRSTTEKGEVTVRLLCSKSRVAPLKCITLPRLELCAANLLAQLTSSILKMLTFKPDETIYWSDSTITLNWIKGSPSRWKQFVRNRVASIQEISDPNSWNYVPTLLNPADLVSRGVPPEKFIHSALWENGPDFLKLNSKFWPSQPSNFRSNSTEESMMSVNAAIIKPPDDIFAMIKTNNDFQSLQRVIAYILRFKKSPNYHGRISTEELSRAHDVIVRHIQRLCFPTEYAGLSKENFTVKSQLLKSLSLFMDANNIIRVGGRLQHSSLPYEAKHQILLPSNHDFTLTIMMHYHKKLNHVGPQSLLAAVRELYWPINGKRLCTKVFRECVICFRARPLPLPQQLGNLPPERITPSPPFYSVGVDYFGPMYIHYRIRGKQPTKTYGCVFVCFVTKAIHIELASDLSTPAFLGTLKRFVATRGVPQYIFSDNATNFIGANSTLNELYKLMSSEAMHDALNKYCEEQQIIWKFTPPCSPNFGGLHEAGVKLAKFHLRRTIGTARLTYEQLFTVIKDVEAILNSRPITQLSNSPDDLDCLTPGHFLIGRRLTSLPIPHLQDHLPLDTWKLVDHIKNHFWRRWSAEYLRSQQQRYQWINKTKNIAEGELVVLIDDNLPPMKWKLGRVVSTFPGDDGLIRVVDVKTSTGIFKRGITKVCRLPSSVETGITFQGRENDESNNPI